MTGSDESVPSGPGRRNIAFTPAAEQAARRLANEFGFPTLTDVARVGVAFALRKGSPLSRPEDFGSANGSNFNIGTIDPQGELKGFLMALHPEITEDPYRVIETLMTVGTLDLDKANGLGEILSLTQLIALEDAGQ